MTKEAAAASDRSALDEEQVRDILRQVIDPEVGRDIVSLGLVYRVETAPDSLVIEMTMTSPACPMGDMIVDDVHAALAKVLPATIAPDIRLVWEPPWNPSMMDEATKQHFGWTPE
jgi:metal-sulfur cluster biosynthetic enzyme